MKKSLILFTVLLISLTAFAQKFELTPRGFVDSEDHTKNYLVLEFPNKSKEDLFNETMIYLTKYYISAKDVISKVDNEVITISAVSPYEVPRNIGHIYKNNYTFVLSFKDGKIKIDEPNVRLTRYVGGKKYTLHIFWDKWSLDESEVGIYGKKNKLKSLKAKESLELFAQRFVLSLKLGLNQQAQNNDW